MEVSQNSAHAPSISIVLPAYNEADAIKLAVQEAREALAKVSDDFQVIVVDDGSTDQTAAIVGQMAKQHDDVLLIEHGTNRGYGAAIRSGFECASKELVGFTDADMQLDLGELDRFTLLAKDYDVVCGYRIDRKDTWFRCFVSKVYNWIARMTLGIGTRDIDCAFKIIRRSALAPNDLTEDGFLINSELLLDAKKNDLRIVEVGVSHRPRELGSSTVSMWHVPPVLSGMAKLWWNRVAVSEQPTKSAPSLTTDRTTLFAGLLVAVVAAIMLFSNISYPLIDRDETRYAEIPREMVVTGDWVMPQLNFKPYYDKPPLFYWATAISYKIFGVSEQSARIVPALCGFLMTMATFWFSRRYFGLGAAMLSSVVMLTSMGFMFCGRFLFIDPMLSLLVMLSTYFAYEAINAGQLRFRWWIAAAVCCGLGVLAKGPIAGVLIGPPLFAFAWLSNSHAKIRLQHWLAFAAVVAGVAVPWFVLAGLQDPDFLYEFFYNHNLRRFAGAYHEKPIWFFIPIGLAFLHPWTCLTLPIGVFLLTKKEQFRQLRTPELGYLFLMVAWCFVFFSISRCKLPAYILPAAPLVSIMFGYYLKVAVIDRHRAITNQFSNWVLPWLAAIETALFGIGMSIFLTQQEWISSSQPLWYIAPWIIVLLVLVAAIKWMKQPSVAWSVCGVLAFVFVLQGSQQWVPSMSRATTLTQEQQIAETNLPSGTQEIATFNDEWAGIPFYLNRKIPNFSKKEIGKLADFLAQNPDGLIVVDKGYDLDELEDELQLDASFVKVGQRGEAAIITVQPLRTATLPSTFDQKTIVR